MPDFFGHQGTGLCSRTPQEELRLVAVAGSHTGLALEILWGVCTQWQRLGYPTVVLDGSTPESDAAPGLSHLLEHSLWIDPPTHAPRATEASLAVLPAAGGLAALARTHPAESEPLQRLQPLLRRYAVVVVYAPVAALSSPLMAGSTASPLLVLGEGEAAVMRTYGQLKSLALHAGLGATVVAPIRFAAARAAAQQQLRALGDCAARHLGRAPQSTVLEVERGTDLQRLALQLLDNAVVLAARQPGAALPSTHRPPPAPTLAASH